MTSAKKVKVAINGFGRIGASLAHTQPFQACTITGWWTAACNSAQRFDCCAGRNFLRCVELREKSNLEVIVINDSGRLCR